jgi:hypothetical protein
MAAIIRKKRTLAIPVAPTAYGGVVRAGKRTLPTPTASRSATKTAWEEIMTMFTHVTVGTNDLAKARQLPSRAAVAAFHKAALAAGGKDEGAVGPRGFWPNAYAGYCATSTATSWRRTAARRSSARGATGPPPHRPGRLRRDAGR